MAGKDNKEDKTREEAGMTLSPVFPKSSKVVQKCPRVVQIHISGVFYRYPSFGSLLDCFGPISKCHIKLSLEMPEKITFSEIKVQSYAF